MRFWQYLNPFLFIHNLWFHRELLSRFILWEVEEKYRGSVLGLLWAFIVPLLRLFVYTIVFSILLRGRGLVWGVDSDIDAGKMIFAGVVMFSVFAESISQAPRLMWINRNYVKNVVFPLDILPLSVTGSAVLHSFIGLTILLLVEYVTSGKLLSTIVYLPLVYIPIVPLTAGITWLLAALGVFNRDINNLMQALIQLIFFLTAIVYPLERLVAVIPSQFEWLLRLNLLSTIVDDVRRVMFKGQSPDWYWFGITLCGSLLVMLIGNAVFQSLKRDFADLV